MYIPKRYGQSKAENCPFCGKQAVTTNKQGVGVCVLHKEERIPEIKCVCGSYLEIKSGKYGPYFVCINCGNINLNKGMELLDMKAGTQQKVKVNAAKSQDKEVQDSGKYKDFDYGIY